MKLKDFDIKEIYQKWMEGAGAFRCFSKSTNFATLKNYPNIDVCNESFSSEKYNWFLDEMDKFKLGETLVIIDIPGEEAIEVAYIMQNYRRIKPIITFNNIIHPNQLIGNDGYISNLVLLGSKLNRIENEPLTYGFILDEFRFGDYNEVDFRNNFNNQYEITEGDLPSFEMLKELGFNTVVYFSKNGCKEDIDGYLNYLCENNISVIKNIPWRTNGQF